MKSENNARLNRRGADGDGRGFRVMCQRAMFNVSGILSPPFFSATFRLYKSARNKLVWSRGDNDVSKKSIHCYFSLFNLTLRYAQKNRVIKWRVRINRATREPDICKPNVRLLDFWEMQIIVVNVSIFVAIGLHLCTVNGRKVATLLSRWISGRIQYLIGKFIFRESRKKTTSPIGCRMRSEIHRGKSVAILLPLAVKARIFPCALYALP